LEGKRRGRREPAIPKKKKKRRKSPFPQLSAEGGGVPFFSVYELQSIKKEKRGRAHPGIFGKGEGQKGENEREISLNAGQRAKR